jgi:hypothetical protein
VLLAVIRSQWRILSSKAINHIIVPHEKKPLWKDRTFTLYYMWLVYHFRCCNTGKMAGDVLNTILYIKF